MDVAELPAALDSLEVLPMEGGQGKRSSIPIPFRRGLSRSSSLIEVTNASNTRSANADHGMRVALAFSSDGAQPTAACPWDETSEVEACRESTEDQVTGVEDLDKYSDGETGAGLADEDGWWGNRTITTSLANATTPPPSPPGSLDSRPVSNARRDTAGSSPPKVETLHSSLQRRGRMAKRIQKQKRLRQRKLRRARDLLKEYGATVTEGTLTKNEFKQVVKKVIKQLELLHPLARMRGKWNLPAEFATEPDRTERILAHPFRILHTNACDAKESMAFHLFGKAAGHAFVGMCFAWGSMTVQCILGAVVGLGPSIPKGSTNATIQIWVIALGKLGWAVVMICWCPCLCLLTNSVTAIQFVLEGAFVVVTFLSAEHGANKENATMTNMMVHLMLLPVFLPVLQKCYDSLLVNLILNCSKNKFNTRAALITAINFVLSIPAFIAKMCGLGASAVAKFNPAKMSSSAKALVESVKKGGMGGKMVTSRVVRRRVDANGNVLLPGETGSFGDEDSDNDDEGPGGEGEVDIDEGGADGEDQDLDDC